jgi:hypothetical protein
MQKSVWLSMMAGAVCGSVSLVASAQVAPQQPPQQRQRSSQVVATVNDQPITQQELQRQLQAQRQAQPAAPGDAREVQQRALNALVETRLIEQYALEQGPEVKPQEISQQMQQLRQRLQKQDITLQQVLRSQGQSEAELQKQIAVSLAWQKLIQQRVTPQKLQQYYQANQERFPAENFQQAQPQVQQAYTAKVWEDIVREMKPKAEIEIKSQPAGGVPPQPAPQPSSPPQR